MKKTLQKTKGILLTGVVLLSVDSVKAQCSLPTGVTASPSVFCAPGGTLNLNATSLGNSINWYTVPVGGAQIGSSPSGANFVATAATTTTFYAESFAIASGTFNYSGSVQTYTVPGGVSTLTVDIKGAQGGTGFNPFSNGGNGGRTTGTISVIPGQVLNIYVGGAGGNAGAGIPGAAGFNGGGIGASYPGNYGGGGGGGASDIRISPYALANRLAIAGGGGGGGLNYFASGFDRGGMGGGLTGEGGYSGNVLLASGYPGSGGTQVAGGNAGNYPGYCAAFAGSLGIGGNGGPCTNSGGGGGGGYYGGGGGVWSGGGGGSSFLVNGTLTQGFQAGAGQVIITGAGCISASRTPVIVTVNPNPTVTIAGPSQICIGANLNLTGNGATSYSWSNGSLSPNIITSPTANVTYTVIGTTGGCTNTAIQSVTVNALPVVSIAGSNTLCAGSVLNLTGNGASTYTWNTGATTNTIAPSPTANITYTVFGTSGATGCSNSAILSVTVNSIPTLTMTGPNAMCLNQTITLNGYGANTYTWSTGSTFSNIAVSPTVNSTYTVTGSSNLGCMGAPVVKNISVNSIPVVSATAPGTLICKGTSLILTGNGVDTYSWSTGALTSTISVTPLVTTGYTVVGTNTATGCYNTASLSVAVYICTGIEQNSNGISQVLVYPNPNNGEFTVELNNGLNKTIEVYDIMGRSILTNSSEENKININMSALSNGIYYVKILSDNSLEVVKIVKQ